MRKQICVWLKAGVMNYTQGGILRPLLVNIALHRLETHLKDFVETFKEPYKDGNRNRDKKITALGVIRYANDFVLLHSQIEILEQCILEIKK